MLVIGAKGHAKEVLEIFYQKRELESLYFFDDMNPELPDFIFTNFKLLKSIDAAKELFIKDSNFVLGLGNPLIRYKLSQKFLAVGGILSSIISPFAHIGHYDVILGRGVDVMTNVIITNSVNIGEGTLLNRNVNVSHDVVIGKYCELAPSVNISGNCTIGNFCNFGTGAVVLPKITIGDNVIVGAGAVVTENIANNSLVVGVPAKVIKKLDPLNFE